MPNLTSLFFHHKIIITKTQTKNHHDDMERIMKFSHVSFIHLLFIQSSFSISSSNDQSFLNFPSKKMEPKDDVDDDNLVLVSKSSPSGLIENFRQAAGIHNIYRCALNSFRSLGERRSKIHPAFSNTKRSEGCCHCIFVKSSQP